MIILNLKGGLGNQLFQYATGKVLSIKNKDVLKLDSSGFARITTGITIRNYAFSNFNIKAEIATTEEIKKIKYPYGPISKVIRLFNSKVLRNFNIAYNAKIMNRKGDTYLDGFFQTEKYFIDYEKEIRQDFTLKNPLSTKAQQISELIKNTPNSISLHVRRGDYVNDKNTQQHHGSCGPEYYSKALEFITSKIGKNINIFVFSDDINWVKENMPLNFPTTYVSSPEIPDYEELILMSKCNHNIIANSSFSWWGAWLNENRDKIVITPIRWVLTGEKNFRDIIPSTWHKI